jgi:endogenous inhibitor of DNA gyrase (YacG/DUF329 family)
MEPVENDERGNVECPICGIVVRDPSESTEQEGVDGD